jgi:iron(III) transport system permease protein
VLLLLVTAALPMLMLLWDAFMPFPQPPSLDGLRKATLANFPNAWNYGPAARAALNSLLLGLGAGVLTTLIGWLVAWGLLRQKALARVYAALDFLGAMPIAIPGIIVGISFVWFYLTVPVPVYGTPWILLLAYVTLHLPFAVRICSSALLQVSTELEEAARSVGARRGRVSREITLPLIRHGLLGSWLLVFMIFEREYSTGVYLLAPGTEVIGAQLVSLWQGGAIDVVAALSLINIVLVFIGLAFALRFGVKLRD